MKNLNLKTILKETYNLTERTNNTISNLDDYGDLVVISEGLLRYANCKNNNLISEDSLNRLLRHTENDDWAIITAYRSAYGRRENIKRNRTLRAELDKRKMGPHILVGHWRECKLQGVKYDDCPEDELVDSVERSYFVPKPSDMDSGEFKNLMLDLMTIDGETQDAILWYSGDDETVYLLSQSGEVYDKFSDLSLNKMAQAYTQHVKKMNVPFVFEGTEIPGSISGKKLFEYENVKYI